MKRPPTDEEPSEEEAAKRRDEALRRALGTKHVPHKDESKKREPKR